VNQSLEISWAPMAREENGRTAADRARLESQFKRAFYFDKPFLGLDDRTDDEQLGFFGRQWRPLSVNFIKMYF
jgi:hypothetical protein